jgi:hypothetical protein
MDRFRLFDLGHEAGFPVAALKENVLQTGHYGLLKPLNLNFKLAIGQRASRIARFCVRYNTILNGPQ